MKLDEWKTITEIVGIAVTVIGALIGGIFAGYQYLEKEKADRVKESLSFVERFHKPPTYDSWQRITNAWLKYEARMDALLDDPKLRTDQWVSFVRTVVKNEKLTSDVLAVIDFFGVLQICVRSDICDAATAKAFFGSEARTFFRLHYSVIDAKRKSRADPTFAKDLEEFAKFFP
ncbi:MAG: hypothetical protein HYY65_13325 [Candidatus Tectomicrobia bacterium]|uniref:DUF4760 domain-containing protein n=1 Tax=Tectimicrobiota bacterium TaxID=2528274 RepID=A0A932GRV2_UNCTE|nr:hypothetical protein [Candidatus Tectomicrobia bacterium]